MSRRFGSSVCVFLIMMIWCLSRYHYFLPAEIEISGQMTSHDFVILRWNEGQQADDDLSFCLLGPSELVSSAQLPPPSSPAAFAYQFDRVALDNEEMLFEGWAVMPSVPSVRANVFLVLTSGASVYRFTTERQKRFDVTAQLRQRFSDSTNYDDAGFLVKIPRTFLPAGDYTIGLFLRWDGGERLEYLQHRVTVPASANAARQSLLKRQRLPQRSVNTLIVEASQPCDATIILPDGKRIAPDRREGTALIFTNLEQSTRKMHPLLLTIQVIVSLLAAWGAYEVSGLKMRYHQPNWRATLKFIFWDASHRIFWTFFVASSAAFGLWLLANWPGMLTYDSFLYWQQTKTLVFREAWLYTSILLMLAQFADTPAIVGMVQMFCLSGLLSYVCYFAITRGASRFLVLPVFGVSLLSIPMGIFNTILWKDIPFSLLIAFWAWQLYALDYYKKHGVICSPSWKRLVILAFAFIALCLVRPNGLPFFVFLPAIIFFKRLMPMTAFRRFLALACGMFLIGYVGVPRILGVQEYSKASVEIQTNPVAALFLSKSYYSDTHEQDMALMEKLWGDRSTLERYYNPALGKELLDHTQFERLTDADRTHIRRLFRTAIIRNMPIFVADRAHIFFAAVFSQQNFLQWNDLWKNNIRNLPSYQDLTPSLSLFHLKLSPKSLTWYHLLSHVEWVASRGLFRIAVWNLLSAILFFFVVFMCYKWVPSSAVSACFVLIQLPFLFLTLVTPSFRFFYFLHIYAYLAIPLLVLELQTSCRMLRGSEAEPEQRWFGVSHSRWLTILSVGIVVVFVGWSLGVTGSVLWEWYLSI